MREKPSRLTRRTFLASTAAVAAAGPAAMHAAESEGLKNRLRAGAAEVDLTPAVGLSLEGYFMKLGPIKAIHDPLYARAIVLDDGNQRIAMLVCDHTIIPGDVFDRAKRLINQRTGLPMDRIMMSCTHTHAAMRVGLGQGEEDLRYVDETLVPGMADAVCKAIENLAPARLGYGFGAKPEYTHNRRWFMKPGSIPVNPFGKNDQVKFNPSPGSKNLVKPAGPVDPQVSVLSVQHADGSPMALLANYSIHYVGGFKGGEVSADYFGVFAGRIRELLAEKSSAGHPPFVGMMSNGTSGNIGAGYDFRKPRQSFPAYARMKEVGDALADEVARVERAIDYRGDLSLAMAEQDLDLAVRRPDEEQLAWARGVLAQLADPTKKPKWPHLWTPLYAKEAMYLSEGPERVPVKLQAIRIGELLIGAIPNEVFAETGLALKRESPSKYTFLVELANAYHGYLPTPEQHKLGGYETWPARSSCLETEAEPKIRAGVLELMRKVV